MGIQFAAAASSSARTDGGHHEQRGDAERRAAEVAGVVLAEWWREIDGGKVPVEARGVELVPGADDEFVESQDRQRDPDDDDHARETVVEGASAAAYSAKVSVP